MTRNRRLRWRCELAAGFAAGIASLIAGTHGAAASDPTRPDAAECSAPEVQSVPTDRAGTAEIRSRVSVDALADGFGVQYWGPRYDVESLAAQPHGLLIVEAARASASSSTDGRELWFTPEDIDRMRLGGTRPVLAYLNVGRIETYRDYWIDAAAADAPPDFQARIGGDGRPVPAYWSPAWREVLFDRLDRILDMGFDGVMLDDLLQYYDLATDPGVTSGGGPTDGALPGGAAAHARAMMSLVLMLRQHADARRCGVLIVVNNGVFIGRDAGPDEGPSPHATFDAYRTAIDAILIESLFTPQLQEAAITALAEDYAAAGVPILDVEFSSLLPELDEPAFRALAVRNAARLDAIPYVAQSQAFDRLAPPIIPWRQTMSQR